MARLLSKGTTAVDHPLVRECGKKTCSDNDLEVLVASLPLATIFTPERLRSGVFVCAASGCDPALRFAA